MGPRATEWSQSLFPCGKQSHPSVLQDTNNFHCTSTTQYSALTDVEALEFPSYTGFNQAAGL
jgi:hypothetical protein